MHVSGVFISLSAFQKALAWPKTKIPNYEIGSKCAKSALVTDCVCD